MADFTYEGSTYRNAADGSIESQRRDGTWGPRTTDPKWDAGLLAAAAAASGPGFDGNTAPAEPAPTITPPGVPPAPTMPTRDAPGASGASFDQAGILKHYGRDGWSVIKTFPEMVDDTGPDAVLKQKASGVPQKKATGRTVWQIKAASGTNAAIQELVVEEDPNPQYGPDAQNPASAKFRPIGEPKAMSPGDTKGDSAPTSRVSLERRGGKTYAVDYTNPKVPTFTEVTGLPDDTPPDKTQLVGPDKDGKYKVVNMGTNPPTTVEVPGLQGKPDPAEARTIFTDNNGTWSVGKDGSALPVKGPNGQQLGVKPGERFTDSATGLEYTMGPSGNAIPVKGPDGKQIGGNKPGPRTLVTEPDGKIWSISSTDPTDKVDTGLKGDASAMFMVGDKSSKKLSIINKQTGETIKTFDNPSWEAAAPTEIAPNTVAPFIHTLVQNPETGAWETKSVPNDNQLTVSQAMMETLYPAIAAQMKDGKIDAQTAKDLMSAASGKMKDEISAANAATAAASDDLQNLNTAATTGAGILKDRAQNANSQMNNWVNAIGGNKNIGLGSQLGDDFGGNLVGGIGAWTAQMAGGQGVLDNAQKAVAAINPDDPHSAPSHATLMAMQDHMKSILGPGYQHPAVVAATTTPMNGNAPPPPAMPTLPEVPPDWQRGDQPLTPPQPNGNALPGTAGTVAPGDPRYLGMPPMPGFRTPQLAGQRGPLSA